MTVVVENPSTVSISGNGAICVGESGPNLVFTASGGTAPYTFTYTVGNGDPQTVTSLGSSVGIDLTNYLGFSSNQPGCYDLTISVTSASGNCMSPINMFDNFICVLESPQANFTVSETVNDLEVSTNNLSTNATSYEWNFGDGTSMNSSYEPIHEYTTEGNYVITLVAYNDAGCTDTARISFEIEEDIIFYVPNTFTPDGDEFNNIFIPVLTSGIDLTSYQMDIFNRWGECIFTTYNPDIGWDGTYLGRMVQDGTYTWKISFKIKRNDEHREYVGHVNMLR